MLFENEFNRLKIKDKSLLNKTNSFKQNISQNVSQNINYKENIVNKNKTYIVNNEVSLSDISDLLEKENLRYGNRIDVGIEQTLSQ